MPNGRVRRTGGFELIERENRRDRFTGMMSPEEFKELLEAPDAEGSSPFSQGDHRNGSLWIEGDSSVNVSPANRAFPAVRISKSDYGYDDLDPQDVFEKLKEEGFEGISLEDPESDAEDSENFRTNETVEIQSGINNNDNEKKHIWENLNDFLVDEDAEYKGNSTKLLAFGEQLVYGERELSDGSEYKFRIKTTGTSSKSSPDSIGLLIESETRSDAILAHQELKEDLYEKAVVETEDDTYFARETVHQMKVDPNITELNLFLTDLEDEYEMDLSELRGDLRETHAGSRLSENHDGEAVVDPADENYRIVFSPDGSTGFDIDLEYRADSEEDARLGIYNLKDELGLSSSNYVPRVAEN